MTDGYIDAAPVILRVGDTSLVVEAGDTAVLGSGPDVSIDLGPAWPAQLCRVRFITQWTFHLIAPSYSVLLDGAEVQKPRTVVLDGLDRSIHRLILRSGTRAVELSVEALAESRGTTTQHEKHPQRPSTRQAPPISPSTAGPTWRRIGVATDSRKIVGRRGHGADIELDGLDVAARHASIVVRREEFEIRDLSGNLGTYVNGAEVLFARVGASDRVVIGGSILRVDDDRQIYAKPLTAPVALSCRGVAATYRGRGQQPAIADISFDLMRGLLLAVVGPSGAGKSTLCAVLLGEMNSVSGHCDLGGVDLFEPDTDLQHLVNFVPQGDAITGELTVERSLYYVARLRSADDVKRVALWTRVDEVLEQVSLSAKAKDRVAALSGGQRKRVSIAMELLTRQPLLLLDEPTSGLDEGLDLTIMQLLRAIAAQGTSIVIVTHAMANIDQADLVLALAADGDPDSKRRTGRLAYFGPPDNVLSYFNADRWSTLMLELGAGRQIRRTSAALAPRRSGSGPVPKIVKSIRPATLVHRFLRIGTLCSREARRLGTRWTAIVQAIGVSPVVALFFAAFAGPAGLHGTSVDRNGRMNVVIGVLVVCTALFAMAISFTTIVGERAVIERERRWGVTPSEVIASKFLVSGCLGLLQPTILVSLYGLTRSLPEGSLLGPPNWIGLTLGLSLLGLASVSIGILVSTIAKTLQQASGLLAIVLAVQVVLSGLFIPLGAQDGLLSRIVGVLSYFTPTRWTVALIASDSDMATVGAPSEDQLWASDYVHLTVATAALTGFILGPLIVARLLLWRQLRRGR